MINSRLRTNPICLSIFLTYLMLMSCSNEELDMQSSETEQPNEEVVSNPKNSIFNADGTLKINNTPCDYQLGTLEENETLDIECQIDLQGNTVNIPSNVQLNFKGGEIINGTLKFASKGKIDKYLLNTNLFVKGDVTIEDGQFNLQPERWGIVEGEVSSEVALNNTKVLESLMFEAKELGANKFFIDKLDAYFEVSKVTSTTSNQNFYPQKEAINIPSNFTLEMTNNTILRVFPSNGKVSAVLMAFDEAENATIRGGILYGDRDIRKYTHDDNAEEGTALFLIKSGRNVTIDGVTFKMGSKGALDINSYGFPYWPDLSSNPYRPTTGVVVKNCVFDKIRSIAIAITDGRDITITKNTFNETAMATKNSDGGVVGYTIDIEPIRTRDENGNLKWYQYVEDVVISNNIERNSRIGACTIFAGNNITIEGNDFHKTVGWSFASNSKVVNNTFNSFDTETIRPAIIAGGAGDSAYNNEISGNTIDNYNVAISAYHEDVLVTNNTINNCLTGIQFKKTFNMKISKNIIKSKIAESKGIMGHIATMNAVDIFNNTIDVKNSALFFVELNIDEGTEKNKINIYDNNFKSSGSSIISNSSGINLRRNTFNESLYISNSKNLTITDNSITTYNNHGIGLYNENSNLTINNNNIIYSESSFSCIYTDKSYTGTNVNTNSNNCNLTLSVDY